MPEQTERLAHTESVVAADLPMRRSPDYQSIYVNHIKFGATAFEFSHTFGQISETVEGGLFVEQKIRLLMSPLHAKIFAAIFTQNLEQWEKRFGEIKLPVPIESITETQPASVAPKTPSE